MVFPQDQKLEMSDMLRSVDIVCKTTELVISVFGGKSVYDGDGSESFQYNDVVEFENLSDLHLQAILKMFPFSRQIR